MSKKTEGDIIVYAQTLLKEQRAAILSGKFNSIEEYKAGTATVRNLERIVVKCEEILAGKDAAEAASETNLQEMQQEKP